MQLSHALPCIHSRIGEEGPGEEYDSHPSNDAYHTWMHHEYMGGSWQNIPLLYWTTPMRAVTSVRNGTGVGMNVPSSLPLLLPFWQLPLLLPLVGQVLGDTPYIAYSHWSTAVWHIHTRKHFRKRDQLPPS